MRSAILIITALIGSTTARADDTSQRALAHFKEGRRHYELAEWAAAIVEFKEAYRLRADPAFLFNLAQSHRLAGDCLNAYDEYKSYLRSVAVDAANHEQVTAFVRELEPCATERRSRFATSTRQVRTHRRLKVAGIATGATGIVAVGIGALFLNRSRDASNTLRAAYDDDPLIWNDQLEELERRGPRDQKIGLALATTGGALVVGGVVMLYLGLRPIETPIVIAPQAGGASVRMGWQF